VVKPAPSRQNGKAGVVMQNRILYITLLVSLIITVIIIYFFVSIIRYHRRYMRLQREKIFAEITIRETSAKELRGTSMTASVPCCPR